MKQLKSDEERLHFLNEVILAWESNPYLEDDERKKLYTIMPKNIIRQSIIGENFKLSFEKYETKIIVQRFIALAVNVAMQLGYSVNFSANNKQEEYIKNYNLYIIYRRKRKKDKEKEAKRKIIKTAKKEFYNKMENITNNVVGKAYEQLYQYVISHFAARREGMSVSKDAASYKDFNHTNEKIFDKCDEYIKIIRERKENPIYFNDTKYWIDSEKKNFSSNIRRYVIQLSADVSCEKRLIKELSDRQIIKLEKLISKGIIMNESQLEKYLKYSNVLDGCDKFFFSSSNPNVV